MIKQQIKASMNQISIPTHKKIEKMDDSLRVYKDYAILNRELEFPINLVWTETGIFTSISCKNNAPQSNVNITML